MQKNLKVLKSFKPQPSISGAYSKLIMNQSSIQFIDTADYTAHFAAPHSFMSILCCRVLPKLSNGTNVVFIGSNSEVMLLGVDCLNVIIF